MIIGNEAQYKEKGEDYHNKHGCFIKKDFEKYIKPFALECLK